MKSSTTGSVKDASCPRRSLGRLFGVCDPLEPPIRIPADLDREDDFGVAFPKGHMTAGSPTTPTEEMLLEGIVMKIFTAIVTTLLVCGSAWAQEGDLSPARTATGVVGGATITIQYSAPSVRGRKIFGPGGLVMQDPTAPIWRAGANAATSLHTSATLRLGQLLVPSGNYTLFVDVKDPDAWQLIVNKQTGQWGLVYDAGQDLGRVKMDMAKPPVPIETLKYTISSEGGKRGKLELAWENHVASVPIVVP